MYNKCLLTLAALTSLSSFAAPNEDLVLDGARWLAKANGFVCRTALDTLLPAPASLQSINLAFETMSTDFTLDNGLILGTFSEEGNTCRYSARVLADNSTNALTLVESRAFSSKGESLCAEGKATLDRALTATSYIFRERTKHLTVFLLNENAADMCGEGATEVGVDFVLTKKL